MSEPLLSVDHLSVSYRTDRGRVAALRDVSLTAKAGEVIGIVGESGCGKSTLSAAIINLLGANAEVTGGAIAYKGRDIRKLPKAEQRRLRGRDIAMVFQDPMTAFNPVLSIGRQLIDFQVNHSDATAAEKRRNAAAMLARVGIPDPDLCMARYPHELSGGMRQRAMIAAALLMRPGVLIADEPTTALDVTMEAQIIHLLRELRNDYNGAILVVTHHLGVIAELCDRVYVMYAGEVVEEGSVFDIFQNPRHPYTQALIACDPAHLEERTDRLPVIPGRLPDLTSLPAGCSFAARCAKVQEHCRTTPPPRVSLGAGQAALCHEVRG